LFIVTAVTDLDCDDDAEPNSRSSNVVVS